MTSLSLVRSKSPFLSRYSGIGIRSLFACLHQVNFGGFGRVSGSSRIYRLINLCVRSIPIYFLISVACSCVDEVKSVSLALDTISEYQKANGGRLDTYTPYWTMRLSRII